MGTDWGNFLYIKKENTFKDEVNCNWFWQNINLVENLILLY